MNQKANLLFGLILVTVSAALVGFYFIQEGAPAHRMNLRYDQIRLQHLTEMVGHVHMLNGRAQAGDASGSSADLESMLKSLEQKSFRDPETNERYEVSQISDTEYEICITFSRSYREIYWYDGDPPKEKLKFEPGRNCFTFESDENIGWGLFEYRRY